MAQAQNSAPSASPKMSATCDFHKEVRFAVVMYGGISLAIYINGIAQELLRMVRATAEDPSQRGRLLFSEVTGTEKVYRNIGRLIGKEEPSGADWKTVLDGLTDRDPVHVRFVVDILSGTSAGGINGIYLAKALANGQSLDGLKQLWVTEGDIDVLLNDRKSVKGVSGLSAQKPPQALLNGQRMYRKLLAAFESMKSNGPVGPLADQVDLFVTTTDIQGLPLPLKLADGVAWEKRHKNVFHFSFDSADGVNNFTEKFDPFLAFSARCTSSFPFAFEPFEFGDLEKLLPAGLSDTDAAEWKKSFFPLCRVPTGLTGHQAHACDATAHAFGDGGYLDNKPFSYAIDALSRRSSALPVDRKLIYVEPSPDHPEDQPTPPGRPNVLENILAALSLARYETIREDLQRILDRNRLIKRLETVLSDLEKNFDWGRHPLKPKPSFSVADLKKRIQDFGPSYRSYHRLKISAVTDDIAIWITRASGFDVESDQFTALRALVRSWREDHFFLDPLHAETSQKAVTGSHLETENEFLKKYDLSYRLRRLRFVLNRINQLYAMDHLSLQILEDCQKSPPSGEAEISEFCRALSTLCASLSKVLTHLRKLEEKLRSVGDDNPICKYLKPLNIGPCDLLKILDGAGDSDHILQNAKALATSRALEFGVLVDQLAALLKNPAVAAWEECERALAPPAASGPATALAYQLARHFYDQYEVYDLISFPILYSTEVGDEIAQVDVHRFSPEDAVSIINERKTGRRKLAGTTLAHFGAFLDRGFRRNDILWGRLDGAERLITVLLPGDDYKDVRSALLREAHLAIFKEELETLNQSQLGEIISKAWLATDSQEKNEAALRALAERELGATANPGLQAALSQVLTAVDSEKLLLFYKRDFNCPQGINSKLAVNSLARSTQIVGAMLEDLGNVYQKDSRPGAWIARLGGWFWGFVEVAVPQSVPNLIFRHWLKLLYLLEVLLIVGGMLFGEKGISVRQLGWTALGATFLLNLLLFVLTDLIRGRRRWLNGVAVASVLFLIFLSVLGWTKLPDTLASWGANLQAWTVKIIDWFEKCKRPR